MIITIFLLSFVICDGKLSGQSISNIFGSKICIPGSLTSIALKTSDTVVLRDSKTDFNTNVLNITEDKSKFEKSALTNLHELAQFNDIKYTFKLEKEEGPPHQKTFSLSLKLGNENYFADGTSLKGVQQKIAYIALQNTEYESPPVKENLKNTASLTPTVLLNNLCTKLGLHVQYVLMDEDKPEIVSSNTVADKRTKKSYLQKLNDTIYSDSDIRVRKDLPQSNGPFHIKLQVGENVFYGISNSIQAAKHEAATNAMDFLIKNKENMNLACYKDSYGSECQIAKQNAKSSISLVYEAAQLRKIDVNFEILHENGPAHRKTFTTQCKLGHLTTVGEGKSKKESKRAAADNMMERIAELEPVTQEMQVNSMMKDKKKKKKKKNKIIKTKFEEISMIAGDIFQSVLGYGQTDKQADDWDAPQSKPKKNGKRKHSFQNEILALSNSLNFEIQFIDIIEEGRHYSLLSLLLDPEYVCYGIGFDEKEARNKAALGGINLLYDKGLYDPFQNEDNTPIERETKEAIDLILKQDIDKEKD